MRYKVVIAVGILILLVGTSMPQTQTVGSEACTEGTYVGDTYVEGTCTQAQTEVPNSSRGPTIGVGVMIIVSGAFLGFVNYIRDQSKNAVDISNSTRMPSADKTAIKISAMTEELDENERFVSELVVPVSDIDEAKHQFRSRCEKEDLSIVSKLRTEIIEK